MSENENRTETWSKENRFHWFDKVKFFMGIYDKEQHSPKYGVQGRKSIAVEPRRAYFADRMELRIYNQDKDFADLDFPGLWNISKCMKTRVEVVQERQEVGDNYPDIDRWILDEKTDKNTVYSLEIPTEYLTDDDKDWGNVALWRVMKCANTENIVNAGRFLNAFEAMGKAELTLTVLRNGMIFMENFMYTVVIMPINPQWQKQTKVYERF